MHRTKTPRILVFRKVDGSDLEVEAEYVCRGPDNAPFECVVVHTVKDAAAALKNGSITLILSEECVRDDLPSGQNVYEYLFGGAEMQLIDYCAKHHPDVRICMLSPNLTSCPVTLDVYHAFPNVIEVLGRPFNLEKQAFLRQVIQQSIRHSPSTADRPARVLIAHRTPTRIRSILRRVVPNKDALEVTLAHNVDRAIAELKLSSFALVLTSEFLPRKAQRTEDKATMVEGDAARLLEFCIDHCPDTAVGITGEADITARWIGFYRSHSCVSDVLVLPADASKLGALAKRILALHSI